MAIADLKISFGTGAFDAVLSPLLASLDARDDLTEQSIARLHNRFVDLVNSGDAFDLKAVSTGVAGQLLIEAVPTQRYKQFCAAIRAGYFDA